VPVDPHWSEVREQLLEVETAARAIVVEADIEGAFASFVQLGASAISVTGNLFFLSRRDQPMALAARQDVSGFVLGDVRMSSLRMCVSQEVRYATGAEGIGMETALMLANTIDRGGARMH
jgi:hypothetical protein